MKILENKQLKFKSTQVLQKVSLMPLKQSTKVKNNLLSLSLPTTRNNQCNRVHPKQQGVVVIVRRLMVKASVPHMAKYVLPATNEIILLLCVSPPNKLNQCVFKIPVTPQSMKIISFHWFS